MTSVLAKKMRRILAGFLLSASLPYLVPLAQGQNAGANDLRASDEGQQLFSSNCAACHGLDGRGGEHAPNIATSARVQQFSDSQLLNIIGNGMSGAGMPGFKSSLNPAQLNLLVAYLRILQGRNTDKSVTGDPARGRTLFFGKARCSECHMIEGQGGFLGADLSGYGTGRAAGQIREAIINPDKNLDPRSRIVIVTMRDGRVYRGLARNEDNFSLQLQTLDSSFHLLNKASVRRIEHEPRSFMPANYGSELSRTELDDLVSYLAGLKNGQPAARSDEDDF
jgi:cytochrome c oxidase cbb3-type subunit III